MFTVKSTRRFIFATFVLLSGVLSLAGVACGGMGQAAQFADEAARLAASAARLAAANADEAARAVAAASDETVRLRAASLAEEAAQAALAAANEAASAGAAASDDAARQAADSAAEAARVAAANAQRSLTLPPLDINILLRTVVQTELEPFVTAQVDDLISRLGLILSSDEAAQLNDFVKVTSCIMLDVSEELSPDNLNVDELRIVADQQALREGIFDIALATNTRLWALAQEKNVEWVALAVQFGC